MTRESRLILNVTILAPEPLDDLSNGHILEDRMRGPKTLASSPASHDGATNFTRLLSPKNNFVFVTSFDVVSICSLGSFSHDHDSFYLNFKISTEYLRRVALHPTYIRPMTFLQSAESIDFRPPNASPATQKGHLRYHSRCSTPLAYLIT